MNTTGFKAIAMAALLTLGLAGSYASAQDEGFGFSDLTFDRHGGGGGWGGPGGGGGFRDECQGFFSGYYDNGVYSEMSIGKTGRDSISLSIVLNRSGYVLNAYGTCYQRGRYAEIEFNCMGVLHHGTIRNGHMDVQQMGGSYLTARRR